MPPIKVKHIVSFSSEDPAHPADNMLKLETFRKWKCAKPGEAQVTVVLELEKATKISSVDIGNNGSAFVEVLVGSSTWSSAQDYQVLLVMSSFMTPGDSKTGNNAGRVRMFGADKLNKTVADQKWDRVKLVCTQPFNKNGAYGLSFVKLNSPDEPSEEKQEGNKTPKLVKFGSFTLKDESTPTIKTGSLFFKKQSMSPPTPSQSMAAQVRAASTVAAASITTASSTTVTRETPEVAKTNVNKQFSEKTKVNTAARKTSESSKRKLDSSPKLEAQATGTGKKPEDKAVSHKASPPTKKVKTATRDDESRPGVPMREIMKGVVFALSGFKNPSRGQIRDKALEMGAQYRPDWESGCTHLVCAFPNTPKYNQVKGKGTIVSKAWVIDSYKNKKKMPAKRYSLSSGSSSSSSEESSDEEERIPQKPRKPSTTSPAAVKHDTEKSPAKSTTTKQKSPVKSQTPSPEKVEKQITTKATDDDNIYGGTTDEDEVSSDPDTEDELKKAQKEDDIDEDSTDDEPHQADPDEHKTVEDPETDELPPLPDFFQGKSFCFMVNCLNPNNDFSKDIL